MYGWLAGGDHAAHAAKKKNNQVAPLCKPSNLSGWSTTNSASKYNFMAMISFINKCISIP